MTLQNMGPNTKVSNMGLQLYTTLIPVPIMILASETNGSKACVIYSYLKDFWYSGFAVFFSLDLSVNQSANPVISCLINKRCCLRLPPSM